jgi:multimeric flavodoxin WrbA
VLRIVSIQGSPRRGGNTSVLLSQAVEGARKAGAHVHEIVLRDLTMSPCLEIYGCKKTGRCVIQDDFQEVYAQLEACDGLILASPIFFYTVTAHTKILMDRCQSFWVKRYLIAETPTGTSQTRRQALFISAGATGGKKLFDGVLLTVKYFLDALDMKLWRSLLFRGLDFEGDVLKFSDYLHEAHHAGEELCEAILHNRT